MKHTNFLIVSGLIILSNFGVHCDSESSRKIDDDVFESFENGENPNVVVGCQPSSSENPVQDALDPILRKMRASPGHQNKAELDELLTDTLQSSVASLLESLLDITSILDENDVKYNLIWLSKELVIYQLPFSLLQKLAGLSVVVWIRLDKVISEPAPNPGSRPPPTGNSTWNLGLIDARCINITCFGVGVKIGIMDTGARHDHIELVSNWAGGDFSWWNGTGPKTLTKFPVDLDGRGTQALGLAVGANIGVAPKAKWMACQSCQLASTCTRAAYLLCAQYMACPWKWNDDPPKKATMNCRHRPDILLIGAGSTGGGQLFDAASFYLYKAIELLHSLNVITVSKVGDRGPDCNSVYVPGAYDIQLAVGAVDETATIFDDSSRGPVVTNVSFTVNTTSHGTCPVFLGDPNGCMGTKPKEEICTMIKPDIVAPGVNLNTSTITNSTAYTIVSGTGLAAAHVGGIIALMICSNRSVTWDNKLAYKILTSTADQSLINLKDRNTDSLQYFPPSSHILCNLLMSGICDTFPNNLYGWGLAYACRAVTVASGLKR